MQAIQVHLPSKLPNKIHGNSTYSEDLAREICTVVSTSTKGIPALCKIYEHWPNQDTIYQWRWLYPEFADRYMQAKMLQGYLLAEEIISIADDDSHDYYIGEDGIAKVDQEAIHRARLRIEARKWLAAKLLPKLYGDRVQTDLNITVNHEDVLSSLE